MSFARSCSPPAVACRACRRLPPPAAACRCRIAQRVVQQRESCPPAPHLPTCPPAHGGHGGPRRCERGHCAASCAATSGRLPGCHSQPRSAPRPPLRRYQALVHQGSLDVMELEKSYSPSWAHQHAQSSSALSASDAADNRSCASTITSIFSKQPKSAVSADRRALAEMKRAVSAPVLPPAGASHGAASQSSLPAAASSSPSPAASRKAKR